MSPDARDPWDRGETLHASCVVFDRKGVLILGPSGSGKSGLALRLMALGAQLVADDRTIVARQGDAILATAPDTIRGLIEARGVGLLKAHHVSSIRLALVVDLSRTETDRLPRAHRHTVQGVELPCLHNVEATHFTAAIVQYLRAGRSEP
ncbi:HPr kinase/phosphatase C-terminal domain-containing protein [Sulfitobacter sp. D35]|uniref:HPr kinase/phosphorylase n=1 Tax=Sulfitobacter sp. D35 TaxID=3083252 RepID=UPI00296FF885|nr:HPr kinase/phosphatase C-terminal domain-containing protein [Sulfitobacter sp. D35]MDW4500532.1 HPr kinase/phosphatase C-terminal domain-containing protein [Sulfitobacter sp. D35]